MTEQEKNFLHVPTYIKNDFICIATQSCFANGECDKYICVKLIIRKIKDSNDERHTEELRREAVGFKNFRTGGSN